MKQTVQRPQDRKNSECEGVRERKTVNVAGRSRKESRKLGQSDNLITGASISKERCTEQFGNHQQHVATEHFKCAECN